MPMARTDAATSVVDGKIYAIGGTSDKVKSFRLDIVEVYDPTTGTWAKANKMNHARAGAAVSVVGGKIYVMGAPGCP